MSLFSEEQAAPRRTLLRSTRVRRTAACITVPIGLYAVLAIAGLLPLPGGGGAEVARPVAGLPIAGPTDYSYPRLQGDPRPATTPTPPAPTDRPAEVVGHDLPADNHAGRPTPDALVTVQVEDRARRPGPTVTARPPVLPTPTQPPTATPTDPPGPPSPTPTMPTTPTSSPSPTPPPDTDHPDDDPSLTDRLFALLHTLVR